MKPTRREALIAIATVAAATRAVGQSTFLTALEMAELTALADAIIPRTDTPGASDAGVPAYIDEALARSPKLAETFRAGLESLQADAQSQFSKNFEALSAEQQVALLTPRQDDAFFRMVKGMTVDGYYSSKAGLTEELGWHGNTFLTEFKGCTHPEHQS